MHVEGITKKMVTHYDQDIVEIRFFSISTIFHTHSTVKK